MGRKIRQENHRLGQGSRRRLFQRAFPRKQKSDYLGRELFYTAADALLPDLAEAEHQRKFQYGHVRIRVDFIFRFHPTQKPVRLYSWILSKFAKEGDRILDTHVGSASSLIACYRAGLEYTGFEIDPEYYRSAAERLEAERNQVNMFELLRG